jgi:hypothetical protein
MAPKFDPNEVILASRATGRSSLGVRIASGRDRIAAYDAAVAAVWLVQYHLQ